MANPEHRLALAIIKRQFGDASERICTSLLLGKHVLHQIVQHSKLRLAQVQAVLISLIQHNLVTDTVNSLNDQLIYILDVRKVLQRVRIPRYLALVQDTFGPLQKSILQLVFLHGRVRMSRIFDALQSADPTLSENVFSKEFESLVEHHIILRFSKGDQIDPFAAPRFVRPPAPEKRKHSEDDAQQRKRARLESDADGPSATPDAADPDQGVYWSVNVPQLNRMLRSQWIVTVVSQKIDESAGAVARILASPFPTAGSIISLTADQLVMKLPAMAPALVRSYASVLAQDQSGLISKRDDVYMVDTNRAMGLCRTLSLEQYVTNRFGSPHARLFRLLNSMKHVEREQITRLGMVGSFKDTKIMLNQLFRAGLVTTQEIPKQTDRTPSHCHYVWSSNVAAACSELTLTTIASMANLYCRHALEQHTHARLLSKSQHVGRGGGEIEDYRTAAEKALAAKVSRGLDKLDRAILQMDDFVMRLRDFDETDLPLVAR